MLIFVVTTVYLSTIYSMKSTYTTIYDIFYPTIEKYYRILQHVFPFTTVNTTEYYKIPK